MATLRVLPLLTPDCIEKLPGSQVTSKIVPHGKYPTHDSLYGMGGFKEVPTETELLKIPIQRLKNGTIGYVVQGNTYWKFDGTQWVQIPEPALKDEVYDKNETYSKTESDEKFLPIGDYAVNPEDCPEGYATKCDTYTRAQLYTRDDIDHGFVNKIEMGKYSKSETVYAYSDNTPESKWSKDPLPTNIDRPFLWARPRTAAGYYGDPDNDSLMFTYGTPEIIERYQDLSNFVTKDELLKLIEEIRNLDNSDPVDTTNPEEIPGDDPNVNYEFLPIPYVDKYATTPVRLGDDYLSYVVGDPLDYDRASINKNGVLRFCFLYKVQANTSPYSNTNLPETYPANSTLYIKIGNEEPVVSGNITNMRTFAWSMIDNSPNRLSEIGNPAFVHLCSEFTTPNFYKNDLARYRGLYDPGYNSNNTNSNKGGSMPIIPYNGEYSISSTMKNCLDCFFDNDPSEQCYIDLYDELSGQELTILALEIFYIMYGEEIDPTKPNAKLIWGSEPEDSAKWIWVRYKDNFRDVEIVKYPSANDWVNQTNETILYTFDGVATSPFILYANVMINAYVKHNLGWLKAIYEAYNQLNMAVTSFRVLMSCSTKHQYIHDWINWSGSSGHHDGIERTSAKDTMTIGILTKTT